jgi:hypothetical protein
MRWHHIIGLFASVIVVTWMLSGWLSMDHGRLFSHSEATPQQSRQKSGLSAGAIAHAIPLALIHGAAPTTEIGFNAVGGVPFITAYDAVGAAHLYFAEGTSTQGMTRLRPELLLAGLNQVWPSNVQAIPASDAYDDMYRLAESTAGAALFKVGDKSGLRVYADQYSGRLLAVMDASRRDYAWIYYALHTFQFPGLIQHTVVRTTLVLLLLALGFLASVTGVVLSVKRLRREFASNSEILKPMTHQPRNAL